MRFPNILTVLVVIAFLTLHVQSFSQSLARVTFINSNKQIAHIKYTSKFNDFISLSIKPGDSLSIDHDLPLIIYSSTQNKDAFIFFKEGSVQMVIDAKQKYSIVPKNKDQLRAIQFTTTTKQDSTGQTFQYKFPEVDGAGKDKPYVMPEFVSHYLNQHALYEFLVKRYEYSNPDSLTKLASYLNCSECLSDDMYRRLASSYVDMLSNSISNTDILQLIDVQFKGKMKDFLMFITMKNISTKTDSSFVKNLELFQNLCQDDSYKDYISNMHKFNDPVDGVAGAQLTSIRRTKSTIENLLKSRKGKVIFLDFWASWCSPCLDEMTYSSALKQKFKGKDVAFLYVSIDDNASKWMELSKSLGLNDEDSFIVGKEFRDETKKRFNVKSIPHYILIDKNGKIFDKNSRRPSDAELSRQIDYLLK